MRLVARYAVPLLLVFAVLTAASYLVLSFATRRWFERDVAARAQLAVAGAREPIAARWAKADAAGVTRVLEEISRDERVLAAAACSPAGHAFARSAEWRDRWCEQIQQETARRGSQPTLTLHLNGASRHVATFPIAPEGKLLGRIAVVQDLAFLDRLDELARQGALYVFGAIATLTILALALLARASFRRFATDLVRTLRGERAPGEFQPLLQDVRELVAELRADAATAKDEGSWTSQRLRDTLTNQLGGEKIVVVANREPYIHERDPDGGVRVQHPASGLVTALEPVMRACSGVWVAHGSGSADRQVCDAKGRIRVPPQDPAYTLRRVWLTAQEERGYYYGLANEGLWPLCHLAHARPVFRNADFQEYRKINQRFADAVCEEVDRDDPIILVQDYHFALAPALIRERLPRATILTFWHIPWPNAERFGICPWPEELLQGMLGSSIVGFHIRQHCNNFLDSCDRYLEARIDREEIGIAQGGRTTLVRPYPISIDWPNHWADLAEPVDQCRREVLRELGLREDVRLGVGIDRLDYTKGIEERFLAVERLLELHPRLRGKFVFVQLAAPSRTLIDRYRELNQASEQVVARINARFGHDGYRPIILQRQHHEPPRVFRYLRAADVVYVSSLHDGMNLVAKEFVAARTDERGVLVLSQFTGAARELTEALIVNPYDFDEAASALATALSMPAGEQAARMRAMRSMVAEMNVYRWAGRMLRDAAVVRRRERLASRLEHPLTLIAHGAPR